MTEEEAKDKWCPMVRKETTDEPACAINMTYDGKLFNCIASDCMMWKQDDSYWVKDGDRVKAEDMHLYRTPEEGGFVTVIEGHCGLINAR